MAKDTKQTPVSKLETATINLPIVSAERKKIESLAAMVSGNDEVTNFILAQSKRYDTDIQYLRDNATYQMKKIGEGMNVDTFSLYLSDLLAVAKKYSN